MKLGLSANSHGWRRYSLRTLFIALTVIGLLTGWLGNAYRLVQRRYEFWHHFDDGEYSLQSFKLLPPDELHHISWVRRLMGDFVCGTLLYRPEQDADGGQLREVRRLFPEAPIWGWPDLPLPEGVSAVAKRRAIGDFVPAPNDPRAQIK